MAVHCDILAKWGVHLETWSQRGRLAWKNQQVLRGEEREREGQQRKTSERAGLWGAAALGGFSAV